VINLHYSPSTTDLLVMLTDSKSLGSATRCRIINPIFLPIFFYLPPLLPSTAVLCCAALTLPTLSCAFLCLPLLIPLYFLTGQSHFSSPHTRHSLDAWDQVLPLFNLSLFITLEVPYVRCWYQFGLVLREAE
jgi:hypothetical protein